MFWWLRLLKIDQIVRRFDEVVFVEGVHEETEVLLLLAFWVLKWLIGVEEESLVTRLSKDVDDDCLFF